MIKTGMNRTVSVRLPKLPAKKVHASHLSGSSRDTAVITGMYVIAQTDPATQI